MDAPALNCCRGEHRTDRLERDEAPPVRGVTWVLCWAATLAVLIVSAAVLSAITCRLAAEGSLARAAAAGLRESSLPRATSRSVESVVRSRLAGCFDLQHAVLIEVRHDGRPTHGYLRSHSDGQTSVTLAAPLGAAMPCWLSALLPGQTDTLITTQVDGRAAAASRRVPPLGL